MIKKLVRLDPNSRGFTEIDHVKLRRTAREFRSWIFKIDPDNDIFNIRRDDLPLVEAALSGTLPLPYLSMPHGAERYEFILPREYIEASAPFYNTAAGSHLVQPKIIIVDGESYAWATFEDEAETIDPFRKY